MKTCKNCGHDRKSHWGLLTDGSDKDSCIVLVEEEKLCPCEKFEADNSIEKAKLELKYNPLKSAEKNHSPVEEIKSGRNSLKETSIHLDKSSDGSGEHISSGDFNLSDELDKWVTKPKFFEINEETGEQKLSIESLKRINKTFIKKLKENITNTKGRTKYHIFGIIDKLAGEELTRR